MPSLFKKRASVLVRSLKSSNNETSYCFKCFLTHFLCYLLDIVSRFRVEDNIWVAEPTDVVANWGITALTIDNVIWVIGGATEKNKAYKYTLDGEWDPDVVTLPIDLSLIHI